MTNLDPIAAAARLIDTQAAEIAELTKRLEEVQHESACYQVMYSNLLADLEKVQAERDALKITLLAAEKDRDQFRSDNAKLRKMLRAEVNKAVVIPCDECNGSGYDPYMKDEKCAICGGLGIRPALAAKEGGR